jgi:hypothetical protein
MTDKPKSLAAKMAEVSRECAYVQKTGHNKFHKYNYASAAAVLEKVNESLASRSIACFPSASIVDARDHGDKGSLLVTVRVAIRLVDGETGETDSIEGLGSGSDNGDKAVMKATTAATKYAWMVALNIATGDDPEADESTDKRAAEATPKSAPVESVTAPKRDAAPSPGYDSSLTMRFGPAKGVPISDMGPQDLAFYINAAERGIADPSKAQWRANTEKQLAALKAEYTKRLGADANDDNIPY